MEGFHYEKDHTTVVLDEARVLRLRAAIRWKVDLALVHLAQDWKTTFAYMLKGVVGFCWTVGMTDERLW